HGSAPGRWGCDSLEASQLWHLRGATTHQNALRFKHQRVDAEPATGESVHLLSLAREGTIKRRVVAPYVAVAARLKPQARIAVVEGGNFGNNHFSTFRLNPYTSSGAHYAHSKIMSMQLR
ncbi:hypothetical protein, partial [Pseudomonas aeruginosa]|uniref:hypothetical protein n=1 Tax=Pseudomonas aeruginosa TaxID=287 RepID=UPI0031B69CED